MKAKIMKAIFASVCCAIACCGSGTTAEVQGCICVVHLESPVYYQLARQSWTQGDVKLKVTVGGDGKVASVAAISGHPLLVQKSEENVRKWTFNEGSERNFEMTYEYRLEEPKVYQDPPTRVSFDLPYRVQVVSNFGEPQPTKK
jgi:Gram-negative bacterial TonB protein C-terminal